MKEMHPSQVAARETAVLNGYDPDKVRRAIDTNFPDRPACWVIVESAGKWAVVVYEDSPDTVVSTGNHESRFIDPANP